MNSYGFIGVLLIMAGLGSWAVWERGDAANWHEKFTSLQSSYTQAAQQAKDDAKAQEQKDLASLQSQSSQAIQQAADEKNKAQLAAATYQKKLKEASKAEDLPHKCSGIVIPDDLRP